VFSDDTIPEVDAFTPDSVGDPYLNTEIALPAGPGEEAILGKVVKRSKNNDGLPIGRANADPKQTNKPHRLVELISTSRTSQGCVSRLASGDGVPSFRSTVPGIP
jgi:hypothetical protein